MESSVAGTVFTHKNIIGSMGKQYQYYTIWKKNIVVIIHISWARAIFLLFTNTKTRNLSHKNQKLLYLD